MDRNRLLSARQIEALIAAGQTIVIHNGNALRLDCWLARHPGGILPIQHMVGRDATNEINAYHTPSTLQRMRPFCIGKVKLPWTNFTPPISGGVFRPFGEEEESLASVAIDSSSSDDSEDDAGTTDSGSSDTASTLSSLTDDELDVEVDVDGCSLQDKTTASTSPSPSSASYCFNRKAKAKANTTLHKTSSSSPTPTTFETREIHADILAYPSLDIGTQEAISKEYALLHARIEAEGYYECRYTEYAKDAVRWVILFGLFVWALRSGWYLSGAVALGVFWQQIMFVAHDAGHRGITGNFVADTLIGAFVADFCCGLSIGWWKASHNVHHLVTNMPEHDPDIQNLPLFSTSPSFLRPIYSTFYAFTFPFDDWATLLLPYQAYTYYPIMALARFNLYILSWSHLLSRRSQNLGSAAWTRWVELGFMACYWVLFGYALVLKTLPDWYTRVAFVLVSHCVTLILHVQITLSHWGTSTADLGPGESFPQHQLRTTMDVECPAWMDFLHGGLQFQVVHHLFPRVPRHNLRRLREEVKVFCERVGIGYQCYGFQEGNRIVLGRLGEVADMVEVLRKCQADMIRTGESGLVH